MIPFSILSGQLYDSRLCSGREDGLEIRILEMSKRHFTFRLSLSQAEKLQNTDAYASIGDTAVRLRFYSFSAHGYREVRLEKICPEVTERTEFYTVFSVRTEEAKYAECAECLAKEYSRYVSLKLTEEDAVLSQELTGYPAEQEQQYAADFEQQRRRLLADPGDGRDGTECQKRLLDVWKKPFEFALHLDHPGLWKRYLEMTPESFFRWYFEQSGLTAHPALQKRVDCLYFGSQICSELLPSDRELVLLLEKCRKDRMKPVFVFPPVSEHLLGRIERMLDELIGGMSEEMPEEMPEAVPAGICKEQKESVAIELIVNDWGMLKRLRDRKDGCFSVTMGTMPVKTKKDVRMKYANIRKSDRYKKDGFPWPEFFTKYLEREFAVKGFSAELFDPVMSFPKEEMCVHMPFFQMNTSAFCTLYAACRYKNRGKQHPSESCPRYCERYVCLYPEMLNMVGADNSLFGCIPGILWDADCLEKLLQQGVKRIVWNLFQQGIAD